MGNNITSTIFVALLLAAAPYANADTIQILNIKAGDLRHASHDHKDRQNSIMYFQTLAKDLNQLIEEAKAEDSSSCSDRKGSFVTKTIKTDEDESSSSSVSSLKSKKVENTKEETNTYHTLPYNGPLEEHDIVKPKPVPQTLVAQPQPVPQIKPQRDTMDIKRPQKDITPEQSKQSGEHVHPQLGALLENTNKGTEKSADVKKDESLSQEKKESQEIKQQEKDAGNIRFKSKQDYNKWNLQNESPEQNYIKNKYNNIGEHNVGQHHEEELIESKSVEKPQTQDIPRKQIKDEAAVTQGEIDTQITQAPKESGNQGIVHKPQVPPQHQKDVVAAPEISQITEHVPEVTEIKKPQTKAPAVISEPPSEIQRAITEIPDTQVHIPEPISVIPQTKKQPVSEVPHTEEPIAEVPHTQEPIAEVPHTQEPIAEVPQIEEPVSEPVPQAYLTQDPITKPVIKAPQTQDITSSVPQKPKIQAPVTEPISDVSETQAPLVTEPVSQAQEPENIHKSVPQTKFTENAATLSVHDVPQTQSPHAEEAVTVPISEATSKAEGQIVMPKAQISETSQIAQKEPLINDKPEATSSSIQPSNLVYEPQPSLVKIKQVESQGNQISTDQKSLQASQKPEKKESFTLGDLNQEPTFSAAVQSSLPSNSLDSFLPSICTPLCDFTSSTPICAAQRCRGCLSDAECQEESTLFSSLTSNSVSKCNIQTGKCTKA